MSKATKQTAQASLKQAAIDVISKVEAYHAKEQIQDPKTGRPYAKFAITKPQWKKDSNGNLLTDDNGDLLLKNNYIAYSYGDLSGKQILQKRNDVMVTIMDAILGGGSKELMIKLADAGWDEGLNICMEADLKLSESEESVYSPEIELDGKYYQIIGNRPKTVEDGISYDVEEGSNESLTMFVIERLENDYAEANALLDEIF
tara:strand:+ start:305 stop:910 length:606 start_codon:yes stop_codon:yes gene_type:complete